MKLLIPIIVSCLWISSNIVQCNKNAEYETNPEEYGFGGVVDESPASDPGGDEGDEDAVILPPSVYVGIEERRNSGVIPKLMGLKAGTRVNRNQFTNWLNSRTVSDAQINGLLSKISTRELFHYFLLNKELRKYKTLVDRQCAARFANRPINIMWGDEDITAFDNEVRINSNLTVIKKMLPPIKKHIKALKVNFIQLDDDLPAALIFIHTTLGATLESLEICGGEQHDFEPFKKFTFPALKTLVIFGSDLPKLNYKRIFSRVDSLTIIRTDVINAKNWIPTHFPHLKRLQVEIGKTYFNRSDVLDVLKTNPKLTDLGTVYGDPTLHNQINAKYPNIVNLAVINPSRTFSLLKQPIEMKNIKGCVFAHDESCRQAKYFNFSQLRKLCWLCVRAPKTLFGEIVKNNSNIEIIDVEDAVLTDSDLAQVAALPKLQLFSIGFNDEATIEITGPGLANLVKRSNTLAGIRLKRAKKDFVKEVYDAFTANGLKNWITIPLNQLEAVSHVHFKNPRVKQIPLDDELQFLMSNTFIGQWKCAYILE